MPQAALVAGITAAGALGGAGLAARSANKATKAQQQAGQAALDYQREQDAKREAAYNKGMDAYREAVNAWYGRYGDEAINRYGIPLGLNVPGSSGAVAAPTKNYAAFNGPAAAPATSPAAKTIGAMAGMTPAADGAPLVPTAPLTTGTAPANFTATLDQLRKPRTLGELAGWSRWSNYIPTAEA